MHDISCCIPHSPLHPHVHRYTLSLSLSLTHTHTHNLIVHILLHPSLSPTQTHERTHTQTHAHTQTHTHTHTHNLTTPCFSHSPRLNMYCLMCVVRCHKLLSSFQCCAQSKHRLQNAALKILHMHCAIQFNTETLPFVQHTELILEMPVLEPY